MSKYIAGVGPFEPDIMVILEYPNAQSHNAGIGFQGPGAGIIENAFRIASSNLGNAYKTYAIKYRPPLNNIKQYHLIDVDISKCYESLWREEIEPKRPKVILAVGAMALQAVTGYDDILNRRGSILLARDGVTKVVPTINPDNLYTRSWGNDDGDGESSGGLEYTYLKIIEADIARCIEESGTRSYSIPERDIVLARNSLDTHRYFSYYKNAEKASVDIESINCVPVSIGFAFHRNHAISIPLLRSIGKHQITPMGYNELVSCWRQIDEVLRRIKIVGQNFKYDEFKLGLIGLATPNVYSDVILKTRVIFPELPKKGLGMITSLWTRQPFYKDEGKEFKLGKSPIEQLLKYNGMDCCVTLEADEEQEKDLHDLAEYHKVPLVEYYYNYIMKKHKFYLHMENNGFRVDLQRQKELKLKYQFMQDGAHSRLTGLVGHEVNVASYPQVFSLLYKEMKFKMRKKDPTSEDTIVALMSNHAKDKSKKEILEVLLEEKRIRTQRSRYINFKPDYDDRCKCSFNIISTETCRSSTSSLKKPLRPGKFGGIPFHTISKHGRLAKDIRSMFIPDEGMVFVQVDSSQAEARVVAILSEDWDLLQAFDKIDIHRRTTGLIMGMTSTLDLSPEYIKIIDDMDKDDPMRFCGKKTRHAGNYDMGSNRFMLELNTDAQKFDIPINISSWKAGKMLELFHAASPKIKGKFHTDIIDALNSTRTLIDPYGGVRVFHGRMDDSTYKEGYANIPQRTVGHLVQGAALKIEDELNDKSKYMWISENHDSLLMQAPANNWEPYARLMRKHMQAPIDFSTYCTLKRDIVLTIPADIEFSDTNYGEMRKAKLNDLSDS